MICLAKPNKDPDASFSSDDEVIGEPKMNGLLNHSLRPDGSIDLNNSVTARDRRRKTNESVSLNKMHSCILSTVLTVNPLLHIHAYDFYHIGDQFRSRSASTSVPSDLDL
jgi:hypothetical protein